MLSTTILLFGRNSWKKKIEHKHSNNTEHYTFWHILLNQACLGLQALCGHWTSHRVGAHTWRRPSPHAALGDRLNLLSLGNNNNGEVTGDIGVEWGMTGASTADINLGEKQMSHPPWKLTFLNVTQAKLCLLFRKTLQLLTDNIHNENWLAHWQRE